MDQKKIIDLIKKIEKLFPSDNSLIRDEIKEEHEKEMEELKKTLTEKIMKLVKKECKMNTKTLQNINKQIKILLILYNCC